MRGLILIALALFAMFFGAGNLILPAMIGVNAGENSLLGGLGFLLTGVVLPVVAMVAMSTRNPTEKRLADRIGVKFGFALTTLIFLSTGMLYAIPRVAAVSYEMAGVPLMGSSRAALFGFTAVFFIVAYLAAARPKALVNRIGGWLTPVLLILLLILIAGAFTLPTVDRPATGTFVTAPLPTGIIEGYFTMDAIAALVFGGVITSALATRGFSGRGLQRATGIAGIIAGVLLGSVYIGLVRVGRVGEGTNGADVISGVADHLFGPAGQLIFGLITVLACLTTALGLLGASSQYFNEIVPKVSAHQWLVISTVVSFILANLGLETIMEVVAPLNQLLYPVTITLVAATLIDAFIPGRLYWSYRLPAWVAVALSIFEAAWSTKLSVFASFRSFLDVFPLGVHHMAWVFPALIALAVGLLVDLRRKENKERGTAVAAA